MAELALKMKGARIKILNEIHIEDKVGIAEMVMIAEVDWAAGGMKMIMPSKEETYSEIKMETSELFYRPFIF